MTFPSLQMLQTIRLYVLLAALILTAVFSGVVLPAVWSRKPARRQAALRVLAQLLDAVRRRKRR